MTFRDRRECHESEVSHNPTPLDSFESRTACAASTASADAKPSSLTTSSTAASTPSTLSRSLGIAASTAQIRLQAGLATSTTTAKPSNKAGLITGGTIGGVAVVVLIIVITLLLKRRKIRHLSDHQTFTTTVTEKKSSELQ